jgi:hypothetical protein
MKIGKNIKNYMLATFWDSRLTAKFKKNHTEAIWGTTSLNLAGVKNLSN